MESFWRLDVVSDEAETVRRWSFFSGDAALEFMRPSRGGSWMRLYSRTHLQFVSAPQLCRPFGSSVSAQCLQRSQQFVLSGSVRHHVAVLLQQDAVQRVLVVNVTTHHHYILFPVLQVGAVAQIRGPQELPVLQAEAVPVGVDDLDVITRLLASVQLPEDSSPENWQQTDKSMNC